MRFVARLTAAAFLLAVAQSQSEAGAIDLAPCRVDGLDEEVRCGTLAVPENREQPDGRRITLPIVVVPAHTETPAGAVVFLAGGPGDSSIGHVVGVASHAAELRADRDLLFVDTRGIGGPDRLYCRELAERDNMQGFYSEFLPPSKVAPCRERLGADYDLTRYTTDQGADDLEAVRRALGYGPLDVYGVSYGTRFALVYARRHPESVRTLTLFGVVSTGDRIPLRFALHFEDALARTLAACASEPPCAERFPDLDGDLRRAVDRLATAPVALELTAADTGAPFTFHLTPSGFAQALRYMLYIPSMAVLAPLYIHHAAEGDYRPVAEAAQIFFRLAGSNLADGYYLSTTCSEDVPFIAAEEIGPATRGTLLGDFRIRQQQAACDAWTAKPVDRSFLQPIHSSVPTLLVSGERDPVTPASIGDLVASTLPNSLHVLVPEGGHDVEGLVGADCPDRIARSFIRSGSIVGLDTSCLASIRRPPFVLSLPGADAPRLDRAALEPLVGAYRSDEGLEARIELADDDRLRLTIFGKPPMLLEPRTAVRFAIAGLPPTYALEFVADSAGAVVAVVLHDGSGEEGLRLERQH